MFVRLTCLLCACLLALPLMADSPHFDRAAYEEAYDRWHPLSFRSGIVRFHDDERFQEFLDSGIDLNERLNDLDQTLAMSLAKRHTGDARLRERMEILIEHGLDLTVRDDRGSTLLHYAVGSQFEGSTDPVQRHMVDFLVEHGADVDARDECGRTPLHRAARGGHPATARALLEHGANPRVRDCRGNLPVEDIPTYIDRPRDALKKDGVYWELNDARSE